MNLATNLRGEQFAFDDLRDLFAKANGPKAGDQLAGIAAHSMRQRAAARRVLADLALREIVENPLIDPDDDEVSRLIADRHDSTAFAEIADLTIGQFREWLLDDSTDGDAIKAVHAAITPEIAASVARLMGNLDLAVASSKIRVVTRCRNTLGERGVFGVRVQPNHPTDDVAGILLSAIDGLLFGCGDAVIGVNPAADSVSACSSILRALDRLISAYEIPTQSCCLSHITTQLQALQAGAPIDLLFQSIAGSESANASFGINLALLTEGRERVLEARSSRDVRWAGDQVMYFETGQGSALSSGAHHGVDQLTMEARAHAVARAFDPFLVNSVVGFIGPEYLADERQITRAGLEDHFVGKLLGLPMGVDVCYTNHADADSNSTDNLLLLLAAAGCNYVIGVPCSDDVMLNYQSTSYHDALAVRRLLRLRPAPEFLDWLRSRGIYEGDDLAPQCGRALPRIGDLIAAALP